MQPEGMRQIIAMGGGGFLMEPRNPLLDQFVVETSGAKTPTVCYLPTAGGDSIAGIAQFYTTFNRLDCRPVHLSLFRQPAEASELIEQSDVIYVGGGNTRLMLLIWKTYGVDRLLREAYEKGVLLCGVSAGAICWFEQGSTDSDGALRPLDCLGYLTGSCCPHYDGAMDRRPASHRFIREGKMLPGIALDDGAAGHFVDGELKEIVTSRPGARAYRVSVSGTEAIEDSLPVRFLGETGSA